MIWILFRTLILVMIFDLNWDYSFGCFFFIFEDFDSDLYFDSDIDEYFIWY